MTAAIAWRGSIESPPRADVWTSAATLVGVLVYAACVGPVDSIATALIATVGVAVLGAIRRDARLVHVGVLPALALAVFLIRPIARLWPLPLVIILALYAALVAAIPWLRGGLSWLRRGTIDRVSWLMIAGFVLTSATALVVWRFTTDANLEDFRSFVPAGVPVWLLCIGIVLFAILNAAYEEVLWRGVILEGLEAALGRGALAWLAQGVGFGVWHFFGFPRGLIGVGLATIFALMMGALRIRTRGMLAPIVAHVFADVTIFVLIAAMVLTAR